MCNQTVGLVQAAIEREGIATVSVSLAERVTRAVSPPRALVVPFRFGYPLGEPHNPGLQRRVITAALALLDRTDTPVIEPFTEPAA